MLPVVRAVRLLTVLLLVFSCSGGDDSGDSHDAGKNPDGGTCHAKSCLELGKSCGSVPNGCGVNVECGTCPAPSSCGASHVCGCTPTTCQAQGKNCGTITDGCGATLACGSCSVGQTCGGGGGANVCGTGTCTPTTCRAEGKDCGIISDNCSTTLDCGTCAAPKVCGGSGVANVCGCSPTTCGAQGKNCGTIDDGCGATLDCGSCGSGESCSATNVCMPTGTGGSGGSGGATGGSGGTTGGTGGTTGGTGGTTGGTGGAINTAGIPPDRLTPWNPGILADMLLNLPLDADGLPQRTNVCATVAPGGNIQNAINSCPAGQVVVLGAGTFSVSSTVQLKTGVVLRGAGSQGAPGGTTIVKTGGGSVIAIGSTQDRACNGSSIGTGHALTEDASNGSSTLSVGSNAGQFAAGDMAYVDQQDDSTVQQGDCPYFKLTSGRSATQRVEIAAVSGSTVTLSSPLHWNYKTAQSAKIAKVTATIIKWAGVESLRVQGGSNPGYNGQMAGGIDISNAAYSWVKDIQTGGSIGGMHIAITGSYRVVVRDSYVHHSAAYGYAQDCYGVVVRCASSENLIENNIVRYMNKPVLFNVSGGGNVVGYNYVDNAWAEGTWQETPIDCHCAFPHMELMEGNFASKMGATVTHGNAGYLMYLRNYSSSQFAAPAIWNGSNTINGNVAALNFETGDIGMTAIGNVLGADTPGTSGASNGYASGTVPIYRVGSASDVSNTTFLRHGNYDYFNHAVTWDSSIADHRIPVSLYRTSKPAFFGNQAWPWAGSDLTPRVGTLPAKARSDANYSPPTP